MEFLTVLIIFFVISRLVEALGGGSRGRGGTPPRRPQGQVPRQQRPGSPEGSDAPAARRPEDAAAEMIPDELWELLTGEKRQRPRVPAQVPPGAGGSLPAPTSAGPPVIYDDPTEEQLESFAYDEEAQLAELELRRHTDEDAEAAALLERRRKAALRRVERLPERIVPEVVSLETEPLPERERHRRFHAKIDRPKPVAAPRPSSARRLGLGGPQDLRRAFILHEVLGPPISLRDERGGD